MALPLRRERATTVWLRTLQGIEALSRAHASLRHRQGLEIITRACERFICVGYLPQSCFVRGIQHAIPLLKPLQQVATECGIRARVRRISSGEDVFAVVKSLRNVM